MLAATSSACDTPPCRATEQVLSQRKIMRKDRPGSDGTPKTVPNLLQRVSNATLGTPSEALPGYRTKDRFDLVSHDTESPKKATKQQIKEAIRILYDEKKNEGKKTPNINETKNEVFDRLAERDLEAKKNA